MKKRQMTRRTPRAKFKEWFKAFKIFMNTEKRAVILTDRELVVMVNNMLEPRFHISMGCFERWVSPTKNTIENMEDVTPEKAMEFRHFLSVARAGQKMELYDKVIDRTTKNALGARFVMERKFKDMQQAPQVQLNSNPTINITTGNKAQQALIDGIVNGQQKTIDISHKDVTDG